MHTLNGNGNRGGRNGNSSGWWQSIWGGQRESSADLSAYSRLALQLHYDLPRESGMRSVLLVTPGECRLGARASIGLTFSLGQELNRPTLLVDACPANHEVSEILSCAHLPGWADLLQDPALDLRSVILPSSSEYVRFLSAGTQKQVSASPEGVQARLKAAQEECDFLVLFGGSVLGDYGSMALVPHVGAVLLLVEENETLIEDLKAAQEALVLCKARNVRLVLTQPLRGKSGLSPDRRITESTHRPAISSFVSEQDS